MAYINNPSIELEYEITFLKGCTLYSAIGNRPICREIVLEALDELNENAMRSFSRTNRTEERRVADLSQVY
eukprot:11169700-Lingulodinium_polyedra.AAC.1